MHRKNTGGCTEISLGDFELCDYDRSVMYMVQRISYRASFGIKEQSSSGRRKSWRPTNMMNGWDGCCQVFSHI